MLFSWYILILFHKIFGVSLTKTLLPDLRKENSPGFLQTPVPSNFHLKIWAYWITDFITLSNIVRQFIRLYCFLLKKNALLWNFFFKRTSSNFDRGSVHKSCWNGFLFGETSFYWYFSFWRRFKLIGVVLLWLNYCESYTALWLWTNMECSLHFSEQVILFTLGLSLRHHNQIKIHNKPVLINVILYCKLLHWTNNHLLTQN